jgi:hypothetical protein
VETLPFCSITSDVLQTVDEMGKLWVVLMNCRSQTRDSVRQRHPLLKLVNPVSALSLSLSQLSSGGQQLRMPFRKSVNFAKVLMRDVDDVVLDYRGIDEGA